MGTVIIALVVLVPLVELAVFFKVGEAIGIIDAVGVLIVVSLAGMWLVKRQGLGIIRRMRAELDAGRAPAVALVDGLLVLGAGLLLAFPGFVTDAFGLALLVPGVRGGVRRVVRRRFERRLHVSSVVVRRERGEHRGPGGSDEQDRSEPRALPPG